jgi:hypothetical protein
MIQEIKEEDANEQDVPDEEVYIFFKLRLMQARCNKSIGMSHVAHSICSHIMLYVQQQLESKPKKFWLTAGKAAAILATMLANAREYDDGLLMIENISGKVTNKIIDHFVPEHDETATYKRYDFAYRKQVAQHLIHFMDYEGAEKELNVILEAELDYYGMMAPVAEESKDEKEAADKPAAGAEQIVENFLKEAENEGIPIDREKIRLPLKKFDLSRIKLDNLKDLPAQEYVYSKKAHPFFKVLDTLVLLAECHAFRLRAEAAEETYEYILNGYEQIFGTRDTVMSSYILQQ